MGVLLDWYSCNDRYNKKHGFLQRKDFIINFTVKIICCQQLLYFNYHNLSFVNSIGNFFFWHYSIIISWYNKIHTCTFCKRKEFNVCCRRQLLYHILSSLNSTHSCDQTIPWWSRCDYVYQWVYWGPKRWTHFILL